MRKPPPPLTAWHRGCPVIMPLFRGIFAEAARRPPAFNSASHQRLNNAFNKRKQRWLAQVSIRSPHKPCGGWPLSSPGASGQGIIILRRPLSSALPAASNPTSLGAIFLHHPRAQGPDTSQQPPPPNAQRLTLVHKYKRFLFFLRAACGFPRSRMGFWIVSRFSAPLASFSLNHRRARICTRDRRFFSSCQVL